MRTCNENRWKILVIDDAESNIECLLDILGTDYDVSVALDGDTALHSMTTIQPDLILLDVMMPGLNGYQVCERLKCNTEFREIPIIFLTALSEATDEETGLQLGAVDYITKPFSPKLVQLRVYHQLELKQHRDDLEDLVAGRTQELQQARDATIASMAILAEFRDNETGAHIQRTTHFVRLLAEHLAQLLPGTLPPDVIELLVQSAPLHDIGKVGIPDNILLKPGQLTDTEFTAMQTHTLLGATVIRKAEAYLGTNSFLQQAREIAECHHEKWDGSGYPHGLQGEEIPLSARIMAIADVYDALTTERPYKPAFTHEDAVRIITEGDGRTRPDNFDPFALTAFEEAHEGFRRIVHLFTDRVPDLQMAK